MWSVVFNRTDEMIRWRDVRCTDDVLEQRLPVNFNLKTELPMTFHILPHLDRINDDWLVAVLTRAIPVTSEGKEARPPTDTRMRTGMTWLDKNIIQSIQLPQISYQPRQIYYHHLSFQLLIAIDVPGFVQITQFRTLFWEKIPFPLDFLRQGPILSQFRFASKVSGKCEQQQWEEFLLSCAASAGVFELFQAQSVSGREAWGSSGDNLSFSSYANNSATTTKRDIHAKEWTFQFL